MSRLFDDLMEGAQALEQHLQGKITLRTETRERIEPASITAEEVKAIREKLNLSQAVFAQKLRTSVRTYQGWEQGKPNLAHTPLYCCVWWIKHRKPLSLSLGYNNQSSTLLMIERLLLGVFLLSFATSTRARGVKSLWAYLSKPYIQLNFYNRKIKIL